MGTSAVRCIERAFVVAVSGEVLRAERRHLERHRLEMRLHLGVPGALLHRVALEVRRRDRREVRRRAARG